jgi:hypothetical protein
MAKVATLPISLRLAKRDIEQLNARAATVSGTATAVARELITIGLAGGDNKALADRLTHIERRLAALENLLHQASQKGERIETIARDLCVKFDALVGALTSNEGPR